MCQALSQLFGMRELYALDMSINHRLFTLFLYEKKKNPKNKNPPQWLQVQMRTNS